jgi:hypothetical protein
MYKLYKSFVTNKIADVIKNNNSGYILCIPFDPANTDYQAYLKWVAEGNTPLPAEGAE